MKLIAGLGNPGARYADTRHNIGFMIAEAFAARHDLSLKRKGHQAFFGVGRAAGVEVVVLLPQTFMNLSGASVRSACQSFSVPPADLVVVHDEIDLPFGELRLKAAGGHGGHNGLRSIAQQLGTGEFLRLRVGVGRPPGEGDVSGHVLGPFSAAERPFLKEVVTAGAEALECLLTEGLTAAMNRFNNRNLVGIK